MHHRFRTGGNVPDMLVRRSAMLTNSQRIDAIAWKAKNEKISYGAFSSRLTEKQKDRIYEVHWTNKMEAERKRLERIAG